MHRCIKTSMLIVCLHIHTHTYIYMQKKMVTLDFVQELCMFDYSSYLFDTYCVYLSHIPIHLAF